MSLDPRSPAAVLARLDAAMNQHDLEAFLACFHPEYESTQPAHPDRAFAGTEQVRKNWLAIFQSTPDFRAHLVRSSISADEAWAEWCWEGTRDGGSRLVLRGVTVFGVQEGRIRWGRLYMEPVQHASEDLDAGVAIMTPSAQPR